MEGQGGTYVGVGVKRGPRGKGCRAAVVSMYSGICICVFLAVLSVSSFGQQTGGSHNDNFLAAELEQSLTEHHRHARAPLSTGPLKSAPQLDGSLDQRASIGALLAKYLQQARKGPTGRLSVMGNRVQSIDPTHRINDRDYMGWMDFGRRSAEEYEYSS
ncbi:cholecystokinin isoform X2 [Anas acuta]|uniref:cholecystokinin isoform X2 n=1 Tax=Anas platyrhynchos TaxID=8839 RepID=UPI000F7CDBD2|nr:cholecystokinin isoform X2 [Anas platyrhynchos]|eukprot:XP_027307280.1 cholecystokinin isoform X2 [Anas platyrhynchos]